MIRDPRRWDVHGYTAIVTVAFALVVGVIIGSVVVPSLGVQASSTEDDVSRCQKPADPNGSVNPLRLQVVNGSESSNTADTVTVEIFRLDGTPYCQRSIGVPDESRVVPLVWERGQYHIIVRSNDERASTDIRQVSSTETLESLVVSDDLFSMGRVQQMNSSS